MKKFLISAILCLTVPRVCTYGYKIVGITPRNKDTLLVTTRRQPETTENHVRVSSCDLTGQILDANEFTVRVVSFMRGTDDPNFPVIWRGGPDYRSCNELWLAHWDGTKLQPRLLLKQRKADRVRFRKSWLFEVHGEKKLFVQGWKVKQIRIKGNIQLVDTIPLYCYEFENSDLKLEGEVTIAKGKTESDKFDVECAVLDSEVYIWVCETGRKWSEGLLRVARWQSDGDLKWTECYRGKKGVKIGALTVDSLDGSAAVIFEYSRGRWDASATFCRFVGNTISCIALGRGFPTTPSKNQLLRVRQPHAAWLLMNYHEGSMRIVPIDDKLRSVREIKRPFPYSTSDLHLVCSRDRAVHIVTSTEDGQINIEKLEDFATGKPVPVESIEQGILARFPCQTIEASYKAYVEGEGKNLLRATNDQLARDIISGGRHSLAFLVSYYRLLSRDKKRAERSLAERVTSIVKGGVGKEHWITDMQLALYGEPAIKPLLTIAATGTPEERQIAVEVLYLAPDVSVVNELIEILDKPKVREDVAICLMICDMGLTTHKPEAIDFLIKAAAGRFMSDTGTEEEQALGEILLHESRRKLIDMTSKYKDTPEDWSEESWREWWKKHAEILKREHEIRPELERERKDFKHRHALFQELANMLEENQAKLESGSSKAQGRNSQ